MSLQTPTTIRVHQRQLCRLAKTDRPKVSSRDTSIDGSPVVCLTVKPVGKPDAGNRHVRFDERGEETERWFPVGTPSHRASPRLYLSASGSFPQSRQEPVGNSCRRLPALILRLI